MLNYVKALALGYDSCLDGQTLPMFKKAGFDGIDLGFGTGFFDDGKKIWFVLRFICLIMGFLNQVKFIVKKRNMKSKVHLNA